MSKYDDDMMTDYDYHQNTGELEDYFEDNQNVDDDGSVIENDTVNNRDNDGYVTLLAVAVTISIIIFIVYFFVTL